MRASIKSFVADAGGFTLVETSLIMVILLLAMINLTEFDRYARFARHLETASDGLAVVMAERNAPLQGRDWSDDAQSLFWFFPEAAQFAGADWRNLIGVQVALVRFVPDDGACVSDCVTSRGDILWLWDGGTVQSRALLAAAQILRACGALTPGDATPTAQTLPPDIFQPGMRLIVTLVHAYQPYSSNAFIGARVLVREAYAIPRFGDQMFDSASNEALTCP